MLLGRAHGRRRGADRADHGAGLIADGGADADHAGQEFFAVHGVAVAAHHAQRFQECRKFGDGLIGEALHAVGENAAHLVLGQPGKNGLADRSGVRRFHLADAAGVDAHGVARFAHGKRDHRVTLQGGEMHGFAGRFVDRLQIALRAPRQIDLQAGVAEIHDARAQRVEPPAGDLGGEAALDQRRQQMMAGGDVEAGAGRELGQRRFATGFGNGFQKKQRAIDRLNAVAVAGGTTAVRARSGQDGGVHLFVSPWAAGK